jgi:hypothetical protein
MREQPAHARTVDVTADAAALESVHRIRRCERCIGFVDASGVNHLIIRFIDFTAASRASTDVAWSARSVETTPTDRNGRSLVGARMSRGIGGFDRASTARATSPWRVAHVVHARVAKTKVVAPPGRLPSLATPRCRAF